jgi:hypothetical protein
MVTGDRCDSCSDALRLTECVRHESDLGTSGHVVEFAVMSDHYRPSSGRQYGFAEAAEHFRRLDGKECPPRAWSRSAMLVDGDEVNGVGQPERVRSVARHMSGRTVASQPAATKRKAEQHGIRRQGLPPSICSQTRHP